jgi:hypothetical protein
MNEEVDVWKMINSITDKKYYYQNFKGYVPWIANRYFASHIETFEEAETMNSLHFLDKDMQYNYLYHSIPQKKLKHKQWLKKTDAEKKNENIMRDIGSYLGYNSIKTAEALSLLTEAQKKELYLNYVNPDSKNFKK